MENIDSRQYMKNLWSKINRNRKQFMDFIGSFSWNYKIDFSFHKNYETNIEGVESLIKKYLHTLRRVEGFTFSAFYMIPCSNINSAFCPHHVHMLMLIYNDKKHTTPILREVARRFKEINKCEADVVDNPQKAACYLAKNKNYNILKFENIPYDFYRGKLLKKYPNKTDYMDEKLRRLMK